jgi:asparagine synthase (glutamine-hydrolysing)
MCAIAGKLIFDRVAEESDIELVIRIRDSMIHRGPDASGILNMNNMILAHRRLSIIDLSENANQPMSTEDGRYHLIYNGEIYNFQEIRKRLTNKGYSFRSYSDSEVVLYAFVEYGKNCLKMFNGMFAFAIWDNVKECLFLARDRFGKKPLFYSKNKDSFTFASEIKGLRIDPTISLKKSMEALNCYLALGYILNPLTMYENVFCLEPSSYLKIDRKGLIIDKGNYWDYSSCFRNKYIESEADISENIRSLLKSAIKRRMISDVPIGSFLSGGLDSSSIVALMNEFHNGDLHTFSVGFKQNSYNELPDADKVGKLLRTKHHGLIIDKSHEMSNFLSKIIEVSDQLYSDNSIIPMIELSRLASQNVTVILSGDGADEIFAGYSTYDADRYYQKAILLPFLLRKLLSNENLNFNPLSKRKINFDYKRKQFFRGTLFNFKKAHYSWRLIFDEEARIKILGKQHKDLIYDTDPFKKFDNYYRQVEDLQRLDQHLYVDAMTWLTDDILPKVDRSTMFAGIEARAPFLDIELVNYVAGIPADIKYKNGEKKAVLKKALKGVVPEFVINKKKSGFNAPVYDWIKCKESNEFKSYNMYIYNNYIS